MRGMSRDQGALGGGKIEVVSGVSVWDVKPFIEVRWGGEKGQLDPPEAEQLGMQLIEAAQAARIDAATFAELTGETGLTKEIAATFLVHIRRRTGRMK